MGDFVFISYSTADGKAFARRLADDLLGIPPSITVWLDEREIQAGIDWDEQIVDALRECAALLFLMTTDSVGRNSGCKHEWTRALRYKKPILPLRFHADAEMPYRLEPRQHIDFSGNREAALAKLRKHIQWRSSPEGILHSLGERLSDAKRDLRRADEGDRARIEAEIESIEGEIALQRQIIADPESAKQKTKARIESALERERQPAEPVHAKTVSKFINPPPATAPSWFQDRHVETRLVGDFLKDDGMRLMTVVGRGGVGKTAMVCRLLKALENGHLPDDLGPLPVDGIVYLSPKGLRQVNVPHLYADLCKLLPGETAKTLDEIYRSPQTPTQAKMQALLNAFPQGWTVVLLDNFEEGVDPESGKLRDQELEQALQSLLELPQHGVKVIITTRVAPRNLLLVQPGRQTLLELGRGLKSPYAENILRQMDADGKLGLKDASPELLDEARQRTLGYPRALEALAAILAADRSSTLAELLADTEQLLPEYVVEALVGEAFSSLDPMSQQVMKALAVLSTPVPEGAVDFLLQPYVSSIDSAPILRRLVNMLFARRESGRFHLHQVDRSYAMQRIPEGQPADREASPLPFTRFALLHRAAEYYQTTRTPRVSWKTIDDLAPQLAEIEVRIAGGEYDAAASVLGEIDFDYLQLWGHARLAAELYERLVGHLTDLELKQSSLIGLGNCYLVLSDYRRAIEHYEQSLAIAREIGNRYGEGNSLGNLGNCYYSLGDYRRAIDYHEQSLPNSRQHGHPYGEGA